MLGSTVTPPANGITLSQQQLNQGGCCNKDSAPQWEYSMPTPALEAKGLTVSKLREILEGINNTSMNTLQNNYNPTTSRLVLIPCFIAITGFLLIPIGIATDSGFGLPTLSVVGLICFAAGACLCMATLVAVGGKYAKAYDQCMLEMKQFVEQTLNEQWQNSNNVRWNIVSQQIIETSGSGNDRRISTKTLLHIQVAPLNQPVQPQVVVVQQMPVQGQQMVMLPAGTQPMHYGTAGTQPMTVTAAPPQYGMAPPQYEEAGGAATAPMYNPTDDPGSF